MGLNKSIQCDSIKVLNSSPKNVFLFENLIIIKNHIEWTNLKEVASDSEFESIISIAVESINGYAMIELSDAIDSWPSSMSAVITSMWYLKPTLMPEFRHTNNIKRLSVYMNQNFDYKMYKAYSGLISKLKSDWEVHFEGLNIHFSDEDILIKNAYLNIFSLICQITEQWKLTRLTLFLRQATLLETINFSTFEKLLDCIVGHKPLDHFSFFFDEEGNPYRKHEIRNIKIRGNEIVKQLLEAAVKMTKSPKYERLFTDLIEFA